MIWGKLAKKFKKMLTLGKDYDNIQEFLGTMSKTK